VAHCGGDELISATQRRTVEAVIYLDLCIAACASCIATDGPLDRKRRAARRVTLDLANLVEKRQRLCESLGWRPTAKHASLDDWLAAPPPPPPGALTPGGCGAARVVTNTERES
jgi:hypothetical protein